MRFGLRGFGWLFGVWLFGRWLFCSISGWLRCWCRWRLRFPQQAGEVVVIEPPLHPDRAGRSPWWQGPKLIVEGRIDRITQAVEQLHLHGVCLQGVGRIRAALSQPNRILTIHQEAVAVQGQPQSPAPIAIAQVLERSVPNQPVEQEGVAAPKLSGTDHHQPGGIALWLGAFEFLQLMQPPLLAGSRAFHRFSPGIGGVGREAMASRSERR